MTAPLMQTEGLRKSFGGLVATDSVSLEFGEKEFHAIIGPNGAGKTTLIAQLSGLLLPDAGRIRFRGRNITHVPPYKRCMLGLARSFQITSIFNDLTVLENVALAVQAHAGHSFRFWSKARDDTRLIEPAMEAVTRVGLEDRAHLNAGGMSHGEHRQLEIAMALASEPRLMLLDEPMAGMGPEESRRMVEILRGLKGETTILMIEHDMDAVFALADRITVMVYGRVIATGSPDEIRADEDVRRAYLGDEA